ARAALETQEVFEDALIEAAFQFDGKGRFQIEVRTGEARAYYFAPPGPGVRKFEACAAGPVVTAALDGVPLHGERVADVAQPGTLRFALVGRGTACVQQVQVKRQKWKRPAPGAWTPLFDGRTLAGWFDRDDQEGSRGVENGALVVQSPGEWATLRSEGCFENFRLALKVMALEGEGPRIAVRWFYEGMALHCPAPDGKWHAVEITAKGNQVAATMDGRPAAVVNTDPKAYVRPAGNVLLCVRRGKAAFKDLAVSGAP
ncbi:MAG: DUF1080 domain-containing protein, partial [Planctomycetes bacterium]|nr:DUF1080 domain-containing protein [Planctomycetota bacterium]